MTASFNALLSIFSCSFLPKYSILAYVVFSTSSLSSIFCVAVIKQRFSYSKFSKSSSLLLPKYLTSFIETVFSSANKKAL